MADDAADKATGVIDEARSAAAGTRQAARWMASAFAGIPSLGIIAALVRAPGDSGFDRDPLLWGIALATVGALIGIVLLTRVLTPIAQGDAQLLSFDMTRVPGHGFSTYQEVLDDLADLRKVLGVKVSQASAALDAADQAKAVAAELDAQAKSAEEAAAKSQDAADKARAVESRAAASTKQAEAARLAASAAVHGRSEQNIRQQVSARETIRDEAFRLRAADQVGDRFRLAIAGAILGTSLVAAGIFFLAVAPKPKADAAAAPELVTLTLPGTGMDVLGCEVETVQAIRVGGDDATPLVITFPTDECPAQVVEFQTSEDAPLGTVTEAETATSRLCRQNESREGRVRRSNHFLTARIREA